MNSEMKKELEKRVKHVVSLSKEIPWYVRKYKELGIDPDEIRKPEDLLKAYEKGLYTTSKDLPNLLLPFSSFRQWFLTSGTSSRREGKAPQGKPIAMTIYDRTRNIRACKIGYEKFIQKGDRILNCFPHSPAISGEASTHGLESFEVDVFHTGVLTLANADEFIKWYSIFRPNVIFGLTASLYQLPLKLREANIEPENLDIKKIMTAAQPSSVGERKIISRDFGKADVYDWYASTESLGPIACEGKPFSDEYEVVMPEILVSIVKNSEVLSENERGNVLITNLYNPSEIPHMVVINYLFETDEATCKEALGNGYASIIGKIENAVINLGGSKLPLREIKEIRAELEETIYKTILSREPLLARNYRDEKSRKDIGIIRIGITKDIEESLKKEIEDTIRRKIYERNYPVWEQVEKVKSSELFIEVIKSNELFKGYERYLTPGKPLELIKG